MKINLAVYTAQEGYSWQPGTALDAETLRAYKSRIGKFPSPDASDFPFGGVFLEGDAVVFYRYHVAKKIDFRGRDALYCVLGVVPKAEAARVDVEALFALPEFAEVVQPFPVEADVSAALTGKAPAWLVNLDAMTLDVKITGVPDDLKFKVIQNPLKPPEPPVVEMPEAATEGESVKAKGAAVQRPSPVVPKIADAGKQARPTVEIMEWFPGCLEPHALVAGLVLLVVSLLAVLALLTFCLMRGCGPQKGEGDSSGTIQTNGVQVGEIAQKTQPDPRPPSGLNPVPPVATNTRPSVFQKAEDQTQAAK